MFLMIGDGCFCSVIAFTVFAMVFNLLSASCVRVFDHKSEIMGDKGDEAEENDDGQRQSKYLVRMQA